MSSIDGLWKQDLGSTLSRLADPNVRPKLWVMSCNDHEAQVYDCCSVCGHVPKYWRFHVLLLRAGVSLLESVRMLAV